MFKHVLVLLCLSLITLAANSDENKKIAQEIIELSNSNPAIENYKKRIGLVMISNAVLSCEIDMLDIGKSYAGYLASTGLSDKAQEQNVLALMKGVMEGAKNMAYIKKIKEDIGCDTIKRLNKSLIKELTLSASATKNHSKKKTKWSSKEHTIELKYPSSWEMQISPLPSVIFLIKNCFLCGSQETFSIIVDDAGENSNSESSTLFEGVDLKEFVRESIGKQFRDAKYQRSGILNIAGINAPFILTFYTLQKSGVSRPRALLQVFFVRGANQFTISWASSQTNYEDSFLIFSEIIGSIKF